MTAPGFESSGQDLPRRGRAAELAGISGWINSEPLSLASLRGRIVLVHFWTFACINCIHTLPHVSSWHERYQKDGLVVVGVHTPELPFEHDTDRLRAAVAKHGLTFPIAIDDAYATWRAYTNRYWPALFFIDAQGWVRFTQFGEGNYEECEYVIRALLREAHSSRPPAATPDTDAPHG